MRLCMTSKIYIEETTLAKANLRYKENMNKDNYRFKIKVSIIYQHPI